MWCDVWEKTVIGHCLFEEDSVNVTVSSERYIAMLADLSIGDLDESQGVRFGSNKMESFAILLMT